MGSQRLSDFHFHFYWIQSYGVCSKMKISLGAIAVANESSNFTLRIGLIHIRPSTSVSQFSRSIVSDSVNPWTAARQVSLSITDSGSWQWTGRPGILQSMGSQSQTRLSDWTELGLCCCP